MKKLVTLSDKKYLDQGYLMYQSLLQHSGDFVLYYLCLDEETWNFFQNKHSVIPIHYMAIDSNDLEIHRRTHTWEQHCWCLASYFLEWLRDREVGDLLYIDADLYFYDDVHLIFQEAEAESIGIITHRFMEERERRTGNYNVGVIYFKDDSAGSDCLRWWRDQVLAGERSEWFETHGTCGDQKFLELFIPMFKKVKVIDELVGHAAPWNVHVQEYDGKHITWRGVKQRFVFYHFSHFNLHEGSYRTNRHGEWHPEEVAWARKLYDDYYQLILQLKPEIS